MYVANNRALFTKRQAVTSLNSKYRYCIPLAFLMNIPIISHKRLQPGHRFGTFYRLKKDGAPGARRPVFWYG